jgi:hypothetical protein
MFVARFIAVPVLVLSLCAVPGIAAGALVASIVDSDRGDWQAVVATTLVTAVALLLVGRALARYFRRRYDLGPT